MPLDLSNPSISAMGLGTPYPAVADPTQERVLEFTQRLFGNLPAVTHERDPETNDEYFVVTVAIDGTVEEIVAKNDAWHRSLFEVAGDSVSRFRLSLDPQ